MILKPHGLSIYGDDFLYCDATSGWITKIFSVTDARFHLQSLPEKPPDPPMPVLHKRQRVSFVEPFACIQGR